MNVIEKEALEYAEYEFFNGELNSTIDSLSRELATKLYSLKRKKDKLFFLNILREKVLIQKLEHEKTCNNVNCVISQQKEKGLFVIDQQVEEISESYEYQSKHSDEFSSEQKSELHNALNKIKDKLTELGFGQQIIFDEMDELKEHLNLGKKNWFQLLKGKLFDLTVSKALEKTIVNEIYKTLSKGFDNLPELINKI